MRRFIILLLVLVACKRQPESNLLSETGPIEPDSPAVTNVEPLPPIIDDKPAPPIATNFPPADVTPLPDDDIPIWSPSTIFRDSLDIDNSKTLQQFGGLIFRASDSTGTIIKEAWIELRTNGNSVTTHLCYASGFDYELTQKSDLVQGHLVCERAGKRYDIVIGRDATMSVFTANYTSLLEVYKCVLWTR